MQFLVVLRLFQKHLTRIYLGQSSEWNRAASVKILAIGKGGSFMVVPCNLLSFLATGQKLIGVA